MRFHPCKRSGREDHEHGVSGSPSRRTKTVAWIDKPNPARYHPFALTLTQNRTTMEIALTGEWCFAREWSGMVPLFFPLYEKFGCTAFLSWQSQSVQLWAAENPIWNRFHLSAVSGESSEGLHSLNGILFSANSMDNGISQPQPSAMHEGLLQKSLSCLTQTFGSAASPL